MCQAKLIIIYTTIISCKYKISGKISLKVQRNVTTIISKREKNYRKYEAMASQDVFSFVQNYQKLIFFTAGRKYMSTSYLTREIWFFKLKKGKINIPLKIIYFGVDPTISFVPNGYSGEKEKSKNDLLTFYVSSLCFNFLSCNAFPTFLFPLAQHEEIAMNDWNSSDSFFDVYIFSFEMPFSKFMAV